MNIRYHANRLTQRAAPVVAFDNFREIIEVGYFPEMTAASSSYTIPPRKDNMYLQDMRRDGEYTKVADLQRWHDRLLEAIDNGYFIDVCCYQECLFSLLYLELFSILIPMGTKKLVISFKS